MLGTIEGYRQLTKASGYWDSVLMVPFLLPGVANLTLDLIATVDDLLQLPGAVDAFTPFQTLFVNMLAALTIIWSVRRIRTPDPIYGYYDGLARLVMFTLMIAHMLLGASMILLVFALAEIVWGTLQLTGYHTLNRGRPAS